MATSEEDAQERIIQEEYKIWKKNTPFLYDLVMTHALEWPSLTVQWLPEAHKQMDKEVIVHKMILGTHTSSNDPTYNEPNYLMIAEVCLPTPEAEVDARKFNDENGEVGGFGSTLSKIDIKIKINHDGEVNRARYMPQNSFVVATKSPSSTVFVFDYSKHASVPTNNEVRPQHRCLGHTAEGYGLSWNPNVAGQLLSGSDDARICLWDVNQPTIDIQAQRTWDDVHESVIEDVDWHRHHAFVFGSVGDDGKLLLWDTRQSSNQPSQAVEQAHDGDVNCLAFNPISDYLLVTGGSDGVVNLWDQRNMSQKLHSFQGHTEGVYQVSWCPSNESLLGSCSSDRRLHVWDVSRIGEEQDPEDEDDGPPELLFVHGGHTAKISDFSWNINDSWVIASVAEDNVLQIWQMAESIYTEEEESDDVEDDDLEAPEPTEAQEEGDGDEEARQAKKQRA